MSRSPSLYQINTRVHLGELGRALGRAATLDDIPDDYLDELADLGFDWIWLLGVWETGEAGRAAARAHARAGALQWLPDVGEDDICGSCFAITAYHVSEALGGDAALARLRERLRTRGLRLMLDFVPNHTATDHPWVSWHPDYYVQGTEEDLAREPRSYGQAAPPSILADVSTPGGLGGSPHVSDPGGLGGSPPVTLIAHGRDPYFPAWTDTFQLNYGNPTLQAAMRAELRRIAGQCDGVRCDMAMLLLPEVFARTWGIDAEPFWPGAIGEVKAEQADFTLLAEVYWDLERELQQQGFDFTYDKGLYDRLRDQRAGPVREHLQADAAFQERCARFLENHDEARAAATFPPEVHEAAAILTYLTPGLRFFHEGQLEGRRIHLPMQFCRAPREPTDPDIQNFYARLLDCLRLTAVRDGSWRLIECAPAVNAIDAMSQAVIAFAWERADGGGVLVAVNYGSTATRCWLGPAADRLAGGPSGVRDLMTESGAHHGNTMGGGQGRGTGDLEGDALRLDLPAWGYRVVEVTP